MERDLPALTWMRFTVAGLIVCLTFWGLAAAGGEAAAQTSDTKLWVTAGADVQVGRRVELDAEQELRVGADTAFDQTHTQVGADVRARRWLRFGALYRFIVMEDERRHRFAAGAELVASPSRWRFGLRSRMQATTRPADDTQWLARTRGKVEYKIKDRLRAFGALELHHQISPKVEFRELRIYLGLQLRLLEDLDAIGYYMRQDESNVANPETNDVIGLAAIVHLGRR